MSVPTGQAANRLLDHHENTPQARLKRFLKGFFVYLLLGPPVGCFTFLAAGALLDWSTFASPITAIRMLFIVILFGMAFGIPFSYVIGSIPAAAAGLIVSGLQVDYRPLNMFQVAGIGALIGVAFALLFPKGGSSWIDWTDALLKLITCLVPTIICWLIIRRWETPTLARAG